ncbi:MAG: hypothetical protein RR846_03680 [Oscillospiraceae bacterium]
MNIDYWNRFLKTGSVQDYLDYRQCISQGGQEEINEQIDTNGQRNSLERNKD